MTSVVTARTVGASAVVGVLVLAISTAVFEPAGLTSYLVRGILFILGAFVVVHGYRLRTQSGSTWPDREGGPRG